MDRSRVIILVLAAFAAGAAALLVRALLGGGTEPVKAAAAPAVVTAGVLVAATDIQPGTAVTPDMVRWQNWPTSSVNSAFITQQNSSANAADVVKGTVARESLVAGEPLTDTKIIHANASGFMAARLTPGMRAVSVAIATETGAGGFILPNDRVDVLLTRQISDNPRRFDAKMILPNIRVLAVDQVFSQDKDQKTVLGKTATLELTPAQAERVARAGASGTISLSLRALGDNADADALVAAKNGQSAKGEASQVFVVRYGIARGEQSSGE